MKRPLVKKIAVLLLPLAVLAAGYGIGLLTVRYVHFPPCPILHYCHVYCPGCGVSRSLISLMHGNLLLSLRQNALILFFLVAAALYYAEFAVGVWGGRLRFSILHKPWVIYSLLVLLGVYLIARNFIPAIAPIPNMYHS